jgi:hypothetical protein
LFPSPSKIVPSSHSCVVFLQEVRQLEERV